MGRHAPSGLSSEATRLYRETVVQYALDAIVDAPSLLLLENASRALDRLRQAEAVIQKEGATVVDRFQQVKPHPMVARVDAEGLAIRQLLAQVRDHSSSWALHEMRMAASGPKV